MQEENPTPHFPEASETSDDIDAMHAEARQLREDANLAESARSAENMTESQWSILEQMRKNADALDSVANMRARRRAMTHAAEASPQPSATTIDETDSSLGAL